MNTHATAFPVVAVDLGGTLTRAGVIENGKEIVARKSVLTGDEPTPQRVIPGIHQAIEQVLNEAGMQIEDIAGIGIGVAGPLDSQTGIVFASPNLEGWHHVPLRALFEEKYGVPIYIDNDANAAGLGEYLFGAGQGSRNFVYMTISTGIGGCVIIDGQMLRGANGTAGELGHMVIDWRGERCNCGNIGCLESIASGTAIARRVQEAIAQGAYFPRSDRGEGERGQIDAKEVVQAALAGVPIANEIIQRAAEALGVALVNILHIFNPEVIALGGGVTQTGDLLLEPAIRIVRQRAMEVPGTSACIRLTTLGADVGLIGAGALVYMNNGVFG